MIAIKQSEAAALAALTQRTVFSLPYWDDRSLESRADLDELRLYDHDRPFRLGFLGAHNSVNAVNFRRFLSVFARYVALYNLPVEVVIAGNVC